ncbi:MAG: hypothetical protein AABY22_25690 [Nanoarchaeota archaeon]
MKIRKHRRFLFESMETVKEIEPNKESIRKFFTENEDFPEIYEGNIEVEPYGFDKRIGWDTYIVCINGKAVGFTDGPLLENAKTL